MASMTPELAEAQAVIAEAAAQNKLAQHEHLVTELRSIRTQIRSHIGEIGRLRDIVLAHDGKTSLIRTKITELARLVSISLNQKPEIADVLPNDAEAVEWERNHRRLVASHDAAVKELQKHGTADPERIQAVKLNHDLQQLRYSEQSLLAKLQGKKLGKFDDKGLSGVA